MRDIKRIKRILNILEKLWLEQPDSRFYQFLINEGLIKDDNELWQTEDDELEDFLTKKERKAKNEN